MKKYNKIKELSGENSGGKWWKMERNDVEMWWKCYFGIVRCLLRQNNRTNIERIIKK